jgi:membrane protease YdiL (CAAX protease family)
MKVQDLPFVVHHRPLSQFTGESINFLELESMIFFSGAVTYLKWWHQVGLKGLENKLIEGLLGFKLSYLRFLWLPIMFLFIHILLVLFTGLPPAQVLMFVLINTLMIGICEELLFRGILFYGASSSFGIWRAVWITAIIFGSVHMLNSLITGDFSASIFQAFFAGTFGICTAALRIRLNTIIPVIIIH